MDDKLDIRNQDIQDKDVDIDQQLRPLRFEDFSGQKKIVENLDIFVKAAKMREEALDHVLLHGPPGLGNNAFKYSGK